MSDQITVDVSALTPAERKKLALVLVKASGMFNVSPAVAVQLGLLASEIRRSAGAPDT